MAAIKSKISGAFFLMFFAFAGIFNVANAQMFNLFSGPQVDIQSLASGWSAGGNATYMTRKTPDAVPIFLQGTTPVISADQLDFDFTLGYEAFIEKQFDGGGKFELKFSALEDVAATYQSYHPGTGYSLATNPPSSFFTPNFSATTTLTSSIISTELNTYIPLGLSTDWILGFRWIEYSENMSWVTGGVFQGTDVDNHLYGFQTGLDTLLISNDLYELSVFGKGGAYGNAADQFSVIPVLPVSSRTFDTSLAAVVEAGIKGSLNITDNISLGFGYTGLYFAGVALAPDQIGTHSPVLGGFSSSRLDTGSAFYHGGFAGLTINK